MQAFAISVVPLGELERAAGTGRRRGAAFVKELLRWFKTDFFKWTNNPACAACGSGQTTCCGMAQPTMEEQSCLAGRVEIYECGSCGAQTRFPRYNSAVKLLETDVHPPAWKENDKVMVNSHETIVVKSDGHGLEVRFHSPPDQVQMCLQARCLLLLKRLPLP